jgi:hypothetical protein
MIEDTVGSLTFRCDGCQHRWEVEKLETGPEGTTIAPAFMVHCRRKNPKGSRRPYRCETRLVFAKGKEEATKVVIDEKDESVEHVDVFDIFYLLHKTLQPDS